MNKYEVTEEDKIEFPFTGIDDNGEVNMTPFDELENAAQNTLPNPMSGAPRGADALPSLEAGRALDALIAERVMGLKIIHCPFVPSDPTINSYDSNTVFDDEAEKVWRQVYRHSISINLIPHYSTDITAAWKVIEKLKQDFGDVEICANDFTLGKGYWECTIERAKDETVVACCEAETAPLAICLAALKAIAGGTT